MVPLFFALMLVGGSLAVPLLPGRDEGGAQILRSEREDDGLGQFLYSFDTSNQIGVVAAGRIKNPQSGGDEKIQEIVGCYSYVDTNGQPVVVTYIANELGYQPTITSLQVCPDIDTLRGGDGGDGRGGRRNGQIKPPARAPEPKKDDGIYRIIDEKGTVVGTLPKSTKFF